MHTTNYKNTFIQKAEDCELLFGEQPPTKGIARSIAQMQFELLFDRPYHYTSDEVLFQIHAERNGIPKSEHKVAKDSFFSKGQPCFRTSPLGKKYGWGVHFNAAGKMAIYGCESEEYENFSNEKSLKIVKAMKGKR